MSVVASLVLLILCFSFHACNARVLRAAAVPNDLTKEFQYSSSKRNDEKLNPGSSSTKPAGKNPVRDAPGDATTGKRLGVDQMNGEYDRAAGNRKSDRVKGSEGGESESLSSVSRRVAHRKRGEKEPGFNLDYLPPRTHPPVHN